MIDLSKIVRAIVMFIVAGVIFWLLFWAVDYIGLPEPFNKVSHVVLVLGAVFVVIGILLDLAGIELFKK